MDEALLQALRNVTREHMRTLQRDYGYSDEEVRSVECIRVALLLMRQYNFKQDRPL